MELYRLSIYDEYLLQQHPCDLACLYVGVRHEMPVRTFSAAPTKTQSLGLWGARLDENKALPRNFRLYSTSKGLSDLKPQTFDYEELKS